MYVKYSRLKTKYRHSLPVCIELTMLNVSKINMYYSSAEDSENSEAEDNVDSLNVHGIFCLICNLL